MSAPTNTEPSNIQLDTQAAGRPVFKRRLERPDGRYALFYGFAPHTAPHLPEVAGAVARGGELRRHPLRGEWNVYAPHRQNRTYKPSAASDPLAPSQPGEPPTDVPVAEFELCVFENRFTSLHPDAPAPMDVEGVESARARGRCEVVVYGPEAEGNLHSIGQARRELLLAALVDRYDALFGEGHSFVQPFENRGDAAGVTLAHPHGQIYAFGWVPEVQRRAARAFGDGFSLAAAVGTQWETYGVARANGVALWCPPWARHPLEVWIVPERPVAGPWELDAGERAGVAELLGEAVRRLDAHFETATAGFTSLQAAPRGESGFLPWHFHIKLTPVLRAPGRTKFFAGVESHTGVYTVDVMPEWAAARLRELA